MSAGPSVWAISDLHLDPDRPRVIAGFETLLANLPEGDALFILGDLCEAWVGDDDDSAFVDRLRERLRRTAQRNPISLMHGNRDFLIGPRFAADARIVLIDDPFCLTMGQRRIVLSHGDALCTQDGAYQAVRATFRSREWQHATLSRPLAERRELARSLRAQSRLANANKAENIMDVSADAVSRAVHEHRAEALIHGHTHRPGIHAAVDHRRYVLGDWNRCGWRARVTAAAVTLECFALPA